MRCNERRRAVAVAIGAPRWPPSLSSFGGERAPQVAVSCPGIFNHSSLIDADEIGDDERRFPRQWRLIPIAHFGRSAKSVA